MVGAHMYWVMLFAGAAFIMVLVGLLALSGLVGDAGAHRFKSSKDQPN